MNKKYLVYLLWLVSVIFLIPASKIFLPRHDIASLPLISDTKIKDPKEKEEFNSKEARRLHFIDTQSIAKIESTINAMHRLDTKEIEI